MRGAVLAVATLVLAGGAVASGPGRTRVVAGVTPFTETGLLRAGLHVAAERHGNCIPGSDVLPTDVYRCGAGDGIYDPCWRDYRAHGVAVVCLLGPWDTKVYRLILAGDPGPSPRATAPLEASPWGLELASAVRCVAIQGAHETATGKAGGAIIDYRCTSGVSLLRGLDRSRPVWRARAVRCGAAPPCVGTGWTPIDTAWFGGNNPLRRQ